MRLRPFAGDTEYTRLLDFIVDTEQSLDLGYVLPPPLETLKQLFPTGEAWLALQGETVVGALTVRSAAKWAPSCFVRLLANQDTTLQELCARLLEAAKTRQYRWIRTAVFGYQERRLNLLERLGFVVGVTVPRSVYYDEKFFDRQLVFQDIGTRYSIPPRLYVGKESLYGGEVSKPQKKTAPGPLQMRFRLARSEDAEAWAESVSTEGVFKFLGMGQYEGHMSPQEARERLSRLAADRDSGLIVAEDTATQRAIGFASLEVYKPDVMRHVASVGMHVAPAWQGRGVGSLLLKEVERLAKRKHLLQLELSAFAPNARALHLYRRCGFRDCGEIPGPLIDDYTTELYLYKDLT
jgi:RimJ/RimL family protein N-acetyltransferase